MRSDRYNIFWYFWHRDAKWKVKGKVKKQRKIKVIEIDMMRIDPGAIGFTSGFSQDSIIIKVGEQITIEQLIEKRIIMTLSSTTRKIPTNGAPNLAINGASVVRHY